MGLPGLGLSVFWSMIVGSEKLVSQRSEMAPSQPFPCSSVLGRCLRAGSACRHRMALHIGIAMRYIRLFLVVSLLCTGHAAKIIVSLTPVAKSHNMNMRTIAEELAVERGHDVLVRCMQCSIRQALVITPCQRQRPGHII